MFVLLCQSDARSAAAGAIRTGHELVRAEVVEDALQDAQQRREHATMDQAGAEFVGLACGRAAVSWQRWRGRGAGAEHNGEVESFVDGAFLLIGDGRDEAYKSPIDVQLKAFGAGVVVDRADLTEQLDCFYLHSRGFI